MTPKNFYHPSQLRTSKMREQEFLFLFNCTSQCHCPDAGLISPLQDLHWIGSLGFCFSSKTSTKGSYGIISEEKS